MACDADAALAVEVAAQAVVDSSQVELVEAEPAAASFGQGNKQGLSEWLDRLARRGAMAGSVPALSGRFALDHG
jgi:hypothetical protein